METDYISYTFKDLLTLANVSINNEDGTTYILIEGDKKHFTVCGHLTYQQSWKGNNMIIKLLGTL